MKVRFAVCSIVVCSCTNNQQSFIELDAAIEAAPQVHNAPVERVTIGGDAEPDASSEQQIAFSLKVSPGQVEPGAEGLRCLDVITTNDVPVYISGWDVHKEVTHHVNLWFRKPKTSPIYTVPTACQGGWGKGNFIFDDSESADLSEDFGSLGAIEIPAHADIIFDMHFINTTTISENELVSVDFHKAQREQPLIYGVNMVGGKDVQPVPPGVLRTTIFEEDSPNTLEHLVAVVGHMHAHGVRETFSVGDHTYYDNTSWSEPVVAWPLLDIPAKTLVRWTCTVDNTTSAALPYGASSVFTAEMCSMFGLTVGPQWERVATQVSIGLDGSI